MRQFFAIVFTAISFLLVALSDFCYGKGDIWERLDEILDKNELVFTMPIGYELLQVDVLSNGHYSFTIVNKSEKLKINYHVVPMKEEVGSGKNSTKVDYSTSNFMEKKCITTSVDSPCLVLVDVSKFVTDYLNADITYMSSSRLSQDASEDSGGYKHAFFYSIHKLGVADIHITIFTDDLTEIPVRMSKGQLTGDLWFKSKVKNNMKVILDTILEKNSVVLNMPEGFELVKVEVKDKTYYFSTKHKNKKLIATYMIIPLKDHIEGGLDHKIANSGTTTVLARLCTDLSRQESCSVSYMGSEMAKRVYNADEFYNTTAFLPPETVGDMKIAFIIGVHKDNVADFFLTFFTDNVPTLLEDMFKHRVPDSLKFQ